MDTIISHDEVAVQVANPPSIVPHSNFTNLGNMRRHILRALQCLRCPQTNILEWAGLIMSRAMYGLLTTTLFRLPTDPGPKAIYYPLPVSIVDAQEDPVLNAAGLPTFQAQPIIDRAEQATIDAHYKRAKNYWDLFVNIRRVVSTASMMV